MRAEITLKNYRCFPDAHPAKIILRDGFTAFVGVNNAGKSSILRFFYELRSIFRDWVPNSRHILNLVAGEPQAYVYPPSIFDRAELFSNTNDRSLRIEVELTDAPLSSEKATCPTVRRAEIELSRTDNMWRLTLFTAHSPLTSHTYQFGGAGDLLVMGSILVADISHLISCFNAIHNSIYIGPFRNAVNEGSKEAYFDIQIGQAFISKWREYKAGNLKSQNEACYRLTNDIKNIFGYQNLDVSSSADGNTLQLIVDGRSFKLHEVGAGLTQFVLVLATAAIRQPSFILIDEPELNLHPSLQLDFLTTLGSYASKGVFFATHSIGLARTGGDRTYSVRKVGPGVSEVHELEGTPNLAEFLGELSFSSYKELGFDRTLLVEGRTEVKSIQQFLRLLKRDHEVVIIPLGGAEMINGNSGAELSELTRITNNIGAIIDSERSSSNEPLSKNRQAFVDNCQNAKINCKVLDWRALENYLPERAVRVIYPKCRGLQPFQKRETLTPAWPKAENWRVAREVTLEELLKTDLGKFLKDFCG